MKRKFVCLTLCLLLVLVLPTAGLTQTIFPFKETVDQYYIKIVTTPLQDAETIVTETYKHGQKFAVRIDLGDEILQFVSEESWTPEPDLDLFYANYELRLVGLEKVLDLSGIVVEVYRKKDLHLVSRSVVDPDTGLTLSNCYFDEEGHEILANRALELDYDFDFSSLDLDDFRIEPTVKQEPLTLAEFEALAPWINLADLPLPQGFQIIGYSQPDPRLEQLGSLILRQKYPTTPLVHLWIWISDGLQIFTVDVSFAAAKKIRVSGLEIADHSVAQTIAIVKGEPAAITLQNHIFKPEEIGPILSALTATDSIENLGLLGKMARTVGTHDFAAIDFDSLNQKHLTLAELAEQVPWISWDTKLYGYRGFEIISAAEVEYPPGLKRKLSPHKEHPGISITDLVLLLSDGERHFHIGLSFADDYDGSSMTRGVSCTHLPNGVAILFGDDPAAIFSHSDSVSVEEQDSILRTVAYPLWWTR